MATSPVNTGEDISYFFEKNYKETMFREFNLMRKTGFLCDIRLRVEGGMELYKAHRLILACRCGYFREDRLDDENVEYVMPENTEADALEEVLEYLYSGKLLVRLANVKSILHLAIFLQIPRVQQFCEEFILNFLNAEDAVDFYRLACKLDLEECRIRLRKFILWNFSDIVRHKSYYTFSVEELEEIISSDDLKVKSEKDIYKAVWKWCTYDMKNRETALERLMKNVRFSLLNVKYLETDVVPQLLESGKVSQQFVEMNINKFLNEESQDIQQRRHYFEVILVFNCKSNIVEKYDPVRQIFQPELKLAPVEQHGESGEDRHHRVVRVNNNLYLVSQGKVLLFNPLFVTWKDVGPGIDVRDSTICADEEAFYIVGGKTCEKQVMRYDIKANSWRRLPDLMKPRRFPAVAQRRNKLYAIGGYSQDTPLKEVERFTGTKWIQINSLNQERFQAQAVVVKTSLFALGGRDRRGALDTIEMFCGRLKGWQQIKNHVMLSRRTEFAAIVMDDKIWCLGGRGEHTVECFDVVNGNSTYAGKMGSTYFDINAVTYPFM